MSTSVSSPSSSSPGADWTPLLPPAGSAFPDDLVEVLWSYFSWDRSSARAEWARPQSQAQLGNLVQHAYQASLRSEETRPARFQLVFDHEPSQLTAAFARPLPYSAGELIRLSPAIGIGPRWLVVTPAPAAAGGNADALQLVGICDPRLSPHASAESLLNRWGEGLGIHIPAVTGIQLSALGPAWLRIATWAQRFFELRDCAVRLPFTLHEIGPVGAWYGEVAQGLGAAEVGLGAALVRRVWSEVLSRVRDERHGGCLAVLPAGSDPCRLPVRFKYPAPTACLRQAVHDRLRLEPALSQHVHGEADLPLAVLDEAHFRERDLGRAAELLAALAAVDGAVLLDRDLQLLGFGGEILHAAVGEEAEQVACGPPGPGSARGERRPLLGFGMRHRSAYRLCQQVRGALAFVISQDGDLRVFASDADGAVSLYEGPTPEDWVMAG